LEGKEIDMNIIDGTTGYSLVNEDHILQLITYLMDPGVAICNSVLVYYDENSSLLEMQSRKGAIPKSEAQELIQIQVDELSKQGKIPYTKDIVTGLFELAIDNVYDEFQLQAYAAISDMGFTGCFLIRKGVTSYVPGTLVNALVIDIDEDGNYELLDAYDSWEGNTSRLELVAYEYGNPDYFSSLTEIPLQKYYSCYVPVDGYDKFRLVKEEKDRVSLVGETKVYGTVKIKDNTLCIIEENLSVFLPWDISFDQSRLQKIEKTIPTTPVDITITYGESKLDYIVQETNWEGKKEEASIADAVKQILGKNQDLPRISLDSFAPDYDSSKIIIDFGDSIPDTIKVYDSMLEEGGGVRYNLSSEQTVQIIDDRSVGFPLSQHIAYGLSSNSGDYEKDWRRLFQVKCTWGENECTYSFLINTGKKKQLDNLKELLKWDFIDCEGSYSQLSSSWGIGIKTDPIVFSYQREYCYVWQISEGKLSSFSELGMKPIDLEEYEGYPITFTGDESQKELIWTPATYDSGEDVIIRAFLFLAKDEDKPIAYSELILSNVDGVYQKKKS
jgi:hypothetical protein